MGPLFVSRNAGGLGLGRGYGLCETVDRETVRRMIGTEAI